MKKGIFKITAIVLSILLVLILVVNFGFNYWLKHNLPDFLKQNTDYIIKYKSLDVDVASGNIFAAGISVKNKNPENTEVTGLQGSVDSVRISRFVIWDAVFNKKISSSDILLSRPRLKITLSKPHPKNKKSQNLVRFKNIRIRNGDIEIFHFDRKRKLLSVNQLDLKVKNLQMTDPKPEELPFVFDSYEMNAQNLFFRPEMLYAVTASQISTQNQQLNIQHFHLVPLLTGKQFQKYFPNRKNMLDFKADELTFKDIILKKKKLSVSDVDVDQPELKVYTNAERKRKTSEKRKSFEADLGNLRFRNALVQVYHSEGKKVFSADHLNVSLSRFHLNEETTKNTVPFTFEKLDLNGQNGQFSGKVQDAYVAAFALNEKSAHFRNMVLSSKASETDKPTSNLSVKQMTFVLNDWKWVERKLKLDAANIIIDGMKGEFTAPTQTPKQKRPNYNGIEFPLTVQNFEIRNSDITFRKKRQPLAFHQLNARFRNIVMDENTVKKNIPFKSGNYTISCRNFNYGTPFYKLSVNTIVAAKNQLVAEGFSMQPVYSRSQFIKKIPVEKDLYTIKAHSIKMKGSWDLISSNPYINASQLTIDGVNANIFRSKIPKDDPKIKPLYSEALRRIKFPMYIANTNVKNSYLEYEEDTKESDGPGKLTFSNLSLNAQNLNSGKMKGKPTAIPMVINCKFFNVSPMHVNWNMNTAHLDDSFTISGNFSDLPATRINQFVKPYLKIQVAGDIRNLNFSFKGNRSGIGGTFKMKHDQLKVMLMRKDGGKKKVLSAIANIFVKSSSGDFPESVVVQEVKRDPTKSFFNLFWKGIQEGLTKTLLGNKLEVAKKAAKEVKGAAADAKNAKKKVDEKIQKTTHSQPEEKKEGLLKRIFKKKDKKGS